VNSPAEEPRKADDEDAAWRDIVDSYGERPDLPEPEPFQLDSTLGASSMMSAATWEDEGHFVPPEPPPVPRPHGPRALAWFGVFGVPMLMVILVIMRYSPPSPIGLLMVIWFVGGFGYLVATMGGDHDADSGWNDGAVL
jgi:hypothetical protein